MKNEGQAMCALFQGALLMRVTDLVGAENSPLKQPVRVEQPTAEGNYLPYFLVHLASGIVLRIAVTVEHEPT